ncbi:MAG: MMPL family transporter [Bacteroidales bacterium]|nr:MMPL family transporter [Bacteroidales bacterium]
MDRIFVPLYRFFRSRKPLMYLCLVLSSLAFVFFGLKLRYEEDIAKLLPSSANDESALSFGNLSIKDRIFVQISDPSGESDTYALSSYADAFADILSAKDSAKGCIDNMLYRIDDDVPLLAIDYAMSHVPSFVDVSLYPEFDKAIENADAAMERNYAAVMEDETGTITQAVATDPLGLRNLLLGGGSVSGMASGYTLCDGHLFCRDSTVALLFVAPSFKSFDSGSATILMEELEEARDEFQTDNPGIEILMHGSPVRSVGNSRAIKKDLLYTVGISLILIILLLIISFRSGGVLWQNIVPVLYGTFFALSCMFWIKGQMSLMALGIGAIVLGVALSYCLHVTVHHRYVGDTEKMLRDESTPVCLGCITTIGAFMGLLFTKSDLLRDFGLFASFALAGNTFFALVFLPHFLKEGDTRRNRKIFDFIGKLNSYPYDRKPVLMAFIAAVIVMGFVFAPKVGFDTNLKHIGFESDELRQSEALFQQKNLSGLTQRYYAVSSESLEQALHYSRDLVRELGRLSDEGLVEEGPSPVQSLLMVPQDTQEERIEAWKEYWSEEKIAYAMQKVTSAARKYGLPEDMFYPFEEMVRSDYSPSSLYEAGILPEGLMSSFVEESSGKWLVFSGVKLRPEKVRQADDRVAALEHSLVVDPFYYMSDMVKIVHDDFNVTLAISSLFVLLVLLVSFWNIWVSLLAFIPMFLSWYIVQGTMALFGLEFNLINIIISTFIFGIGVDYSIFVMQGLLAEARGEDDTLLPYHKGAIFFSAVVLLVVVLSFFMASHPAIRSIGISTLTGMASTILLTYTVEPFLFRQMMRIPWIRKSVTRK